MFREIKGQDRALQFLQQAIASERVSQAYLFHGIDGVGKFTTALYFGMALNCLSESEFKPCGICNSCRKFLAFDHPDFIYLFPTPNMNITVDGEINKSEDQQQYMAYIRNKIETPWKDFFFKRSIEIRRDAITMLNKKLDFSIFEAKYRVCIIEDADEMNHPTANSFLKTLEEPPPSTVIILTTNRLSMLLPTIISRCQPIYFAPVSPRVMESILVDKFHASPENARIASRIAEGNVKNAVKLIEDEASDLRELAFEILQMAAAGKDYSFYQSIYNTKTRFSAEMMIELIKYICLYIGDLNLIGEAPEQISNVDKLDSLHNMAESIAEKDAVLLSDRIWRFLLRMEDLQRKVNGNVNTSLILINLYLQLCKVFR